MSNVFNRVGGLKPRRNVFDLSYRKNFTCDMGQLIPVMCDEVVPGDTFKIGAEVVIRMQPLAAPIMHELSATIHYFYLPTRIIWDEWEEFISQGQLADASQSLPIPLPTFDYLDKSKSSLGTLWDYFGFPVSNVTYGSGDKAIPVIDFAWRCYNRVWNEYYRDQDLQAEVDELQPYVLNRNWKKDYFTSSRPFRQKGTAPALPVNVDFYNENGEPYLNLGLLSSASGTFRSPVSTIGVPTNSTYAGGEGEPPTVSNRPTTTLAPRYNTVTTAGTPSVVSDSLDSSYSMGLQIAGSAPNNNGTLVVNLNDLTSQSTTFNVSDLRLAFQCQKWLERNARAGTRYTEFLRSHFGVSPSDSRLDRPEYIGGIKTPVIVSEVLQTSETTQQSPQSNMSGHGLAADGSYVGAYHVQEFGYIIGILSVMPKPAYQDGINRQWLRRLPIDFYFPEFSHLSEQAIYQSEIFAQFGNVTTLSTGEVIDDTTPFGFCGQYDEMRVKHDMVCSEMRIIADPSVPTVGVQEQLSYWNMSRKFLDVPTLNSEFITCAPDKRNFLVPSFPGLVVNVRNLITAVRPIPAIADPGLIDHN